MIQNGGKLKRSRSLSVARRSNRSRAFTLIELLIVVVIIAVLSAASFVEYGSAKMKSRNARRIADIGSISSSLALYFADNKNYPGSGQSVANCQSGYYKNGSASLTASACWTTLGSALNTYITFLPVPPRGGLGSGDALATCVNTAYTNPRYKYIVDPTTTASNPSSKYKVAAGLESSGNSCEQEAINDGGSSNAVFESYSPGAGDLPLAN